MDRNMMGNIFRMRAKDRLIGENLASQDLSEEVKGKPLKIPQLNFTVSLEKKVQSMFGPPHFAVRARRIEDITNELMDQLTIEYTNMIERFGKNPKKFAQQWKGLINSLELYELNDLIEKHNEYYPVEANLNPDPNSDGYLIGSTPWIPKEKISIESLLERFPTDMSAANLCKK